MAAIVRNAKSVGGGTNFTTGTILAGEVNDDFNTIYSDYNGNIDNTNVKTTAAIETSKIDGYSDSATERTTETTPGTTDSVSDAATLAGELERLRYKIKQLGLGSSIKRLAGTAGVDLVSWIDTPQTGPNLLYNGNFAVKTTAAGSAPDGWTLVGTPGTCTTTTTGVTEGHTSARAITLAAAGAGLEGISQTLAGLKASTKYVVGCRARVAAGDTFRLVTTGATGVTFGNLALNATSTSWVTVSGVIVTDATPTNVVVQLLAVADTDVVDVTHCWVRECAIDRIPQSNTAWAYHAITTNSAAFYSTAAGGTDSGLTVNVVCPGPGYIIEVKAKLDLQNDDNADDALGVFQLKENGTEVDSATIYAQNDNKAVQKATIRFDYVQTSPAAGTTYTYTVSGRTVGTGAAALRRNGAAKDTETPKSWIRCRAVLESGGW